LITGQLYRERRYYLVLCSLAATETLSGRVSGGQG
jgi:hypothetical protein